MAYIIAFPFVFYPLFLSYSAVINIGWSKCPLAAKFFMAPAALIFVVMDVLWNCVVGSLLFLQLPKLDAMTFSVRCRRLIATDTGWRGRVAKAIVGALLLPFTQNY